MSLQVIFLALVPVPRGNHCYLFFMSSPRNGQCTYKKIHVYRASFYTVRTFHYIVPHLPFSLSCLWLISWQSSLFPLSSHNRELPIIPKSSPCCFQAHLKMPCPSFCLEISSHLQPLYGANFYSSLRSISSINSSPHPRNLCSLPILTYTFLSYLSPHCFKITLCIYCLIHCKIFEGM